MTLEMSPESPARAWPDLVPTAGRREWALLQEALASLWPILPPCASDPELFFESRSSISRARAVELCGPCPVRELCLAYALASREPEGVWGGLTPTERGIPRRPR